ncbi:MAG TPA: helix-turn-helix domain-containing protein [Chloroflexota bacterium]|nr:helix-turn-helix domain-containing protein [Chloroflexota bacterium]
MDIVELLKQVGLTQYEAEAYYTLLREGPLTGYELGKRSKVPLPRSYDVLERLHGRGLVLVQPGDPPRYLAEDPARFLRHLRTAMTQQLDEIAERLLTVSAADEGEGFWVIRGRDRIRARAADMIGGAEHSIAVRLPPAMVRELSASLNAAAERGCDVSSVDVGLAPASEGVVVLVDGRQVLVGTVTDSGQAVVTGNSALVALAETRLTPSRPREAGRSNEAMAAPTDWLAWEDDKHRRLQLLIGGSDVA